MFSFNNSCSLWPCGNREFFFWQIYDIMEYFQVRRFEKVFDIFAETEIVTKSEIVEAVELLGSIYPQAIFNKNRIQVAFSSTDVIW